jgi:hypothetical protein
MIAEQEQEYAGKELSDKALAANPAKQALASLCQALFSSNSFLYVD